MGGKVASKAKPKKPAGFTAVKGGETVVSDARLDKYFSITKEAIDMVVSSPMDESRRKDAEDFLGMAKSYYSDAQHFRKKGKYVLAFAAVNYAHAWLDAGARLKLFMVNDSRLFAAD